MRRRTIRGRHFLPGLLLLAWQATAAAQGDEAVAVTDLGLYVGWLSYEQYCSRCHGRAGVGSDFAPALPPLIARLTQPEFLRAMEQGYPGTGEALPPWGSEYPTLRTYYEPLWVYLEARGRGRFAGAASGIRGTRLTLRGAGLSQKAVATQCRRRGAARDPARSNGRRMR